MIFPFSCVLTFRTVLIPSWTSTWFHLDPYPYPNTSQQTSPLWANCSWAFSNTMPLVSGISQKHHSMHPCSFRSYGFYPSLLKSPGSSLTLPPPSCIFSSGFMFLSKRQEQVGPLALHTTNMTYHDYCFCSMCVNFMLRLNWNSSKIMFILVCAKILNIEYSLSDMVVIIYCVKSLKCILIDQ